MIKLEVMIKDVDYGDIADKVIPVVLQKLSEKGDKTSKLAKVLGGMKGLPNKIIKAALAVLPQQTKDELAVYFLSEYKEDIISYVNKLAEDKQISVEIDQVNIERVE